MRHFIDLLGRFRRDESGAFAIIFAMIAITLVAMSGAVVDFTSVQQARTKAQVALDSAALALQPTIYNTGVTGATITPQAEALLVNRLADAADKWGDCKKAGTNIPVSTTPPCVTMQTAVVDQAAGTLTLTATLTIPMNFVDLVGVNTMQVQIQSVATRQKLNLEVAMVLDNSGSMAYTMGYNSTLSKTTLPSRMDTLKSSATCAVNILFYNIQTCGASTTGLTIAPDTNIGIVPFTEAVNVAGKGGTPPWWIDQGGTSSAAITNNNFDVSLSTPGDSASSAGGGLVNGNVDRIALFNEMGVQWGGCVEARKSTYDTDATPPSTTSPDTLFTPYFAPDEPSGTGTTYSNSYIPDSPSQCNVISGTCTVTITKVTPQPTSQKETDVTTDVVTVTNSSGKVTSGPTTTTTTTKVTPAATQTATSASFTTTAGVTTNNSSCTCQSQTLNSDTTITNPSQSYTFTTGPTTTTSTSGSGSNKKTTTTVETIAKTISGPQTVENQQCYNYTTPTGLTDRQLQERLCKYNGATLSVTPNPTNVLGPNGDCPAAQVQTLNSDPPTIIAAINAMQPVGGTNITEGAAWGLRLLWPADPFNAEAFDAATSKVLIIMTDGANTIYPGSNMNYDQYYSAYGYPWNQRLLTVPPNTTTDLKTDTTLEGEMNNRLTTVCTNAKNKDIVVYTIGIDVADSGSNATQSAANKTLLTNCATSPANAFFPNSATDLQTAFVSIASQLAALRLAK